VLTRSLAIPAGIRARTKQPNCFWLADRPTTQRESNARRRIGKMLAAITNPFAPSA